MFTTIHRRLLPTLLAAAVLPLAVPAAAHAAPPHAPPKHMHARHQTALLPAPKRRSGRGDVPAPPAGTL